VTEKFQKFAITFRQIVGKRGPKSKIALNRSVAMAETQVLQF